MNLKKVGGDAIVENDTIYSFAEKDCIYLRQQIELYEPDIICCGSGNGKGTQRIRKGAGEASESKNV